MKVRLLYFGRVREITGCPSGEMENVRTLDELRERIFTSHPELKGTIFSMSVNRKMASGATTSLNDNDEVAILPPFAGG